MLPAAPPFLDRSQAGHEMADRLGFLADRGRSPRYRPGGNGRPPPDRTGPVRALGRCSHVGRRPIGGSACRRAVPPPSWAPGYLAEVEEQEAVREENLIRDHTAPPDLHGRTVVIVDDGLSSRSELLAAAEEALVQVPAKLIVASPVLADPVADERHSLGVEVDCVFADEVERRRAGPFWYADTSLLKPAAIRGLLGSARRRSRWRDEVANA